MTSIEKNTKISLSKENLEKLNGYGEKVNELLKEYGITGNIQGLTNGEAESLLKLFSHPNRNSNFEDAGQKRFAISCSEISTEYQEKIKQEKRTTPALNRFLKLTSNLSQEDKELFSGNINAISEAIKNNNSEIINLVNSFNKPEYSKKSASYYETVLLGELTGFFFLLEVFTYI